MGSKNHDNLQLGTMLTHKTLVIEINSPITTLAQTNVSAVTNDSHSPSNTERSKDYITADATDKKPAPNPTSFLPYITTMAAGQVFQIPAELMNSLFTSIADLKQNLESHQLRTTIQQQESNSRIAQLETENLALRRDLRSLQLIAGLSFILFPRLPPEVQSIVWEKASEGPLVIAIGLNHRLTSSDTKPRYYTPVPALFHVSSESRKVLFSQGKGHYSKAPRSLSKWRKRRRWDCSGSPWSVDTDRRVDFYWCVDKLIEDADARDSNCFLEWLCEAGTNIALHNDTWKIIVELQCIGSIVNCLAGHGVKVVNLVVDSDNAEIYNRRDLAMKLSTSKDKKPSSKYFPAQFHMTGAREWRSQEKRISREMELALRNFTKARTKLLEDGMTDEEIRNYSINHHREGLFDHYDTYNWAWECKHWDDLPEFRFVKITAS